MRNTENIKNTVASVSDEELRAKMESVMYALGIPPTALGQRLADMGTVRRVIMNMSESDFNNIIATVGEERAESILRELGKK
ncbi:MAG: hypothetical protein IJ021_08015 [Clostridia bacterium]|nr:hypothetical protein [Clostridia bacterium]